MRSVHSFSLSQVLVDAASAAAVRVFEKSCHRVYGEFVARRAETADDARRSRRDVGMVPKGFTPVDVREVKLDHRAFRRRQCIQDGDRRMRVGARVEDDPRGGRPRLLDPVDQSPSWFDWRKSQPYPCTLARSSLIRRTSASVSRRNVRLAHTKQVEVGTVQHEDRLARHASRVPIASGGARPALGWDTGCAARVLGRLAGADQGDASGGRQGRLAAFPGG